MLKHTLPFLQQYSASLCSFLLMSAETSGVLQPFNKAHSPQLAQNLSVLPAATTAQVRFLSFRLRVGLNY